MRSMTLFRLLPCAAALIGSAGCFVLDRTVELEPGAVTGRAIRPDVDGRPGASFVKVAGVGSNIVRLGQNDGAFVVRDLPGGRVDLRLVDDVDGDGWADRGRIVSVFVGSTGTGLTAIALGNLDLNGSFGVRGEAFIDIDGVEVPAPPGQVARIYAVRGRCTDTSARNIIDLDDDPCSEAAQVTRLEAGAEAETAADSTGAWQLTRVVAGRTEVVGVLYAQLPDGSLGDVVDVVGPVALDGVAADEDAAPRNDGPRLVFDGVPPPPVDIDLVPSTSVGEAAFAVFVDHGTAVTGCATARDTAGAIVVDVTGTADVVRASAVPAGVYDVVVCDGDRRGEVSGQLALPGENIARWPVVLTNFNACPFDGDGIDARDCDGDSVNGLPLTTFETLRAACAEQCFPGVDVLGEGAGASRCTIDGIVYDCDDDSDGQPDVTEPVACIGPGRGTDLDGDGVCSISDSFPQCAANDPVLCVAGDEDITPRVPGGEGRVRGVGFKIAASGAVLSLSGNRLAVLGVLDDNGVLLDDLPVLALDADLQAQLVQPGTTWTDASDTVFSPRLDVAVAGNAIAGGGVIRCVSTEVPCPSFEQQMFSDVIGIDGSGSSVSMFGGEFSLQVPRVLAGATGGSFPVVAGGLTCQQAAPDADGTVTCAMADRVLAPTIENGAASAVLTVPRHSATLESFFNAETFEEVVFVVGGDTGLPAQSVSPTAVTETFVVSTSTITVAEAGVPDLNDARTQHTLTRTADNNALYVVAGGRGAGASSFEVWAEGDSSWRRGVLSVARAEHAAALLPDGRVLIVGGVDPNTNEPLSSTEIVDPVRMTTSRGTSLQVARRSPVVGTIRAGLFVVVGGFDVDGKVVARAERFDVWRDLSSPILPVFIDDRITNCHDGVLDDGNTTVLLRCDTPPAELGVVDDDPTTPELVLVDLPTGVMTCISCTEGATFGVEGEALLSRDGQRVLFATTGVASFLTDINGATDVYSFTRTGLRTGFAQLRSVDDNFAALGARSGAGFGAQLDVDNGFGVDIGAVGFVANDVTAFVGVQQPTARSTLGAVQSVRLGGSAPDVVRAALSIENLGKRVMFAQLNSAVGGNDIAIDVAGGGNSTAPFISSNGEHLAWFTTAPLFDGDDEASMDLVRGDVSADGTAVGTVNLTANIDGDVCVNDDCLQPLSIADDGRVAWVHTTREGGPRALLSTSNGQNPQHVVVLDEQATAVSIAANGKAAAVTRSADARRSVVVVDVDAKR